ncbi:MAG: helix-turn-helix domain-containing protein [Phycisphaerae bacterium]|nr:helix-turn-helix domain-containing protein [Phycisphaerae bacterium]
MCGRKLRRTPLEEIHRARLARTKRLLAKTNLPIRAIGPRCGIKEARFCKVFRKATGLTPTTWHRRSR